MRACCENVMARDDGVNGIYSVGGGGGGGVMLGDA